MKKIAILLALAGLIGNVQASTAPADATYFNFTYDNSALTFLDVHGTAEQAVFTVWDSATGTSRAANFTIYSGHISFSEADTIQASSLSPNVAGSFATQLGINSSGSWKINQAYYYGPTESFMEVGSGATSTQLSGGFTGQVAANNVFADAQSTREELVNIPGFGRAGYYHTTASVYSACPGVGNCTVADFNNGLNTSNLRLDLSEDASAGITSPGDSAAYQRSGYSSLYVYAYQFQGYAGPVPEPETYAMLLAGLGLMGAVARRRRPHPGKD